MKILYLIVILLFVGCNSTRSSADEPSSSSIDSSSSSSSDSIVLNEELSGHSYKTVVQGRDLIIDFLGEYYMVERYAGETIESISFINYEMREDTIYYSGQANIEGPLTDDSVWDVDENIEELKPGATITFKANGDVKLFDLLLMENFDLILIGTIDKFKHEIPVLPSYTP